MKEKTVFLIPLIVVLLNHIFVFTNPIFILATGFLLIITSSLFIFYGSNTDSQSEKNVFDMMNNMGFVFLIGIIIMLIEFFVPYYAVYGGYALSTGTSSFFASLSTNLFTGAIVLVGLAIGGYFLYMIYELFVRKMSS